MKPSDQITKRIAELPAWQGKFMARMRNLVHKADSGITEEWKWDTPVFSHNGLVCAIGSFKDHVSLYPLPGGVKKSDLKGYKTAKGTIRFPNDKPLPAALIRRLVKGRMKENEARVAKRAKK